MGLKTNEIRVFNLYDREQRQMMPRMNLNAMCQQYDLKPARLICDAYDGEPGIVTADDLQKMAEIKYENGKHGEGIVIRCVKSRWSFKVINLLYKD